MLHRLLRATGKREGESCLQMIQQPTQRQMLQTLVQATLPEPPFHPCELKCRQKMVSYLRLEKGKWTLKRQIGMDL